MNSFKHTYIKARVRMDGIDLLSEITNLVIFQSQRKNCPKVTDILTVKTLNLRNQSLKKKSRGAGEGQRPALKVSTYSIKGVSDLRARLDYCKDPGPYLRVLINLNNFTEPTAKKGRGRLKGSAGGPKKANLPDVLNP